MEDLLKKRAELQRQLAAVDTEITIAQDEETTKREALYIEHIDVLMALFPEHSRSSCSDVNPCNADRYCHRCNLLHLAEYGIMRHDFKLWLAYDQSRD